MDNETLLFQLLLETNIAEQGAQAAATLKEVKSAASDAGASVQTMGTQAEQSATKVADAAQKEVSSIQQVNRALETQAEQEARIDKLIADMQTRRAQRTPLELPNTATSAETQAALARGAQSEGFTPPPLQGLTQTEDAIERVTAATNRSRMGWMGMFNMMMMFSTSAQTSLTAVEASMGKNQQTIEATRIAMGGVNIAMTAAMAATMGLSTAMIAATGGIAALGAAIPIAVEWLNQMREAEAQSVQANNDYLRNLYALGQAYPDIAAKARDYAHALADVEIAERQAASAKSQDFLTQAIFSQRVKDAQAAAAAEKNALDAMVFGAQSGYDALEHLRGGAESLIVTTDNLVTAMASAGNTAVGVSGQIGMLASEVANLAMQADAAALATRGLGGDMSMAGLHYSEASRAADAGAVKTEQWNAQMGRLSESMKDNSDEASAWASKVQAAAEKVRSTFQGLVEKALSPTEAKPGPDTWDEFRKRAEAVASGTDPNQYGAKFAQQLAELQKLGMTAEQAAQAFKDMSLFANPKNLDLVDWGPVVADVNHQIDMIIGRANLMREGFDKAWAAMDPAKRVAFAKALDVDPNSANVAQKVFEAMSGDSAQKASNTTGEMAKNIAVIEGTHTSILNFQWDKAKTGIDDAEQYLKDHILKYADLYIEVTAHTTVIPDSVASGASGGAAGPNKYASGFMGMVGPSHGGPNYFVAGEGGENELLMVIPEGAMSFRGGDARMPSTQSYSGGGNSYNAHVNFFDAEELGRVLARELRGRMSAREIRTITEMVIERLSAQVRANDAHAR